MLPAHSILPYYISFISDNTMASFEDIEFLAKYFNIDQSNQLPSSKLFKCDFASLQISGMISANLKKYHKILRE
jgi:hypothetical protein